MDIVMLATADWDNPLWTNKQQLASRWGRLGHRILYIESLGLRQPELRGRDLKRIARRLRRANRLRPSGPGVWVLSPLTLPVHHVPWCQRLNRRWLASLVKRSLKRLGFQDPVLWTYNPFALDYLGSLDWKHIVYHCVDELSSSPGMPAQTVAAKEGELVARADAVITTSLPLAEAKCVNARMIRYFPNPADYESFSRARLSSTSIPEDLTLIDQPRIGFFGAVSDYKLDLHGLADLFLQRPEWQLVLIGPVGEGQPSTKIGALTNLPNVHLLGARGREQLPSYLKGFDVCLLPNRLNRYTKHMFPLKFFEYLAAGKPIAMTALPALKEFWHLAYVSAAVDSAGFGGAIASALAEPEDAPVRGLRIEEARRHNWDSQAQKLLAILAELDPQRR